MPMASPLVWLNGFSGTGKLTIAEQLVALDQTTMLVSNHSLTDPVESHFPRTHPKY